MNRQDLLALQEITGHPALTITLPTHRTSPDNQQDPIRVRNLVNSATERLLSEFNRREIEPLLKHLESVVSDINYRHTLDGLVIFANSDMAQKHYLPFTLAERVVVDDTFLTRDLVFAFNRTPRYWVLVLSEQPTRLFEGTRDTLVELQGHGFPMTHEGPGGATALPGGFGVNVSAIRDERHRQFFRAIDEALTPLLAADPLPLVVVGVDRWISFYEEVTAHKGAIIGTLNGSHDKTSPSDLAALVWPLVDAGLATRREEYLTDLNRAVGEQRVSSTIGEVWRMAHEGRGRLLLVEEDFHFRGRLDATGVHLLPADSADSAAAADATGSPVLEDAVDDVIETVLSKGGRVVFVPNGHLDQFQRIALILRF
jgi:hypothetical protein